MIRYACRFCGAAMESPGSLAGKMDKCPACGRAQAVPNAQIAKEAPTPPAEAPSMSPPRLEEEYRRACSGWERDSGICFLLYCVTCAGMYWGVGFSGLGLGWFTKAVFSLFASAAVNFAARRATSSWFAPRRVGAVLSKPAADSLIPADQLILRIVDWSFKADDAAIPSAGGMATECAIYSGLLACIPFVIVCFTLLQLVLSWWWLWSLLLGLLLAGLCSVILGQLVGRMCTYDAAYQEVQDLVEAHSQAMWQGFTEQWKEQEQKAVERANSQVLKQIETNEMIATQSAECPRCHSKQIVAETSSKGGSTTGAVIGGVLGGFVGAIIGDVVGGAVLGKTGTLFECKSCGNKWDATKKQPVSSKTKTPVAPSSVAAGGCPSCGFSYKFDGATCGHCGFKAG